MGVSLFLPILMPITPWYFASLTLATRWSTPLLLKPMRLMIPSAGITRNRRGLSLPLWGLGVTVPTSIKPNPMAPNASMHSPSLSRPAANPTGLAKESPMTVTGRFGKFWRKKQSSGVPRRRGKYFIERSWACSGLSLNRKCLAMGYNIFAP